MVFSFFNFSLFYQSVFLSGVIHQVGRIAVGWSPKHSSIRETNSSLSHPWRSPAWPCNRNGFFNGATARLPKGAKKNWDYTGVYRDASWCIYGEFLLKQNGETVKLFTNFRWETFWFLVPGVLFVLMIYTCGDAIKQQFVLKFQIHHLFSRLTICFFTPLMPSFQIICNWPQTRPKPEFVGVQPLNFSIPPKQSLSFTQCILLVESSFTLWSERHEDFWSWEGKTLPNKP